MVEIGKTNLPDFDLVVIGAGMIGACTAWYAKKKYPNWRIGVFDRSFVGNGASYYAASLDFCFGHTPLRRELTIRSRELFSELRKEISSLSIKDLPFYGIVQKSTAAAVLSQFTDSNAFLSPEIIPDILERTPELRLPDYATIISGTKASYTIKNDVATQIIRTVASKEESYIFEGTEISDVLPQGTTFKIVTASGETYYSERVVQATGPWMNDMIVKMGITTKQVRIKKIVSFHIYSPPSQTDPVYYFFDDEAFLMPRHEEGYWLFSFKCNHWDVTPEISRLSINQADYADAMKILEKYFPCFVHSCRGGRVFCDAYTADGNPIIEPAEKMPDYIIAGAAAGSGYRLAPGIAEQAIQLLTP